jgi:hypothetical protein
MIMESSAVKLHSPGAVTFSAFLGTPVAGAILLAQNYHRLGNARAARECVILGLTTTLMYVGLSLLNLSLAVLQIAILFGMYNLAQELQGETFRKHIESGGRKCSLWMATGVGLSCSLVIVIALALLP